MGAKATRLFELTKSMAGKGHRVQVITAMPNYPTGRILKGYRRKLRVVEKMGCVRVIRTWIYPSKSHRALPRVLSSLSFLFSSLLFGVWRLGRQDVVLLESPPLFLVPAGLAIGRLTRAKVMMNVSDIWPDLPLRLGYSFGRLSLELLKFLERFGYEHSDVVSLTNPKAREMIRKRFPHVTTTVIISGTDLDLFNPSLRNERIRASLGANPGDFLVGYCGLHGLFQGLEVVVEAAAKLRDQHRIKFILIGDGPTKEVLVGLARQRQLNNVRFEDPMPRSEIPSILASCDAGLAPLATKLPGVMPSKIYEILASGVPVVVSAGCEGETLIRKFDVGRVFRPQVSGDLAAVLASLATDSQNGVQMKQRCRDLAKRYDRNNIALRTDAILRALAENRPLPEVDW